MANDKKFIVKNGLLTQETVVIGSSTDNGTDKLQVTGSSLFTQATSATPSISIRNTGGTGNSVIAEFVGDSDSLQILNIGQGDYALLNSQQDNGIRFHDGTDGVEILYNGSVDIDFNSAGIDFKREPSYNGNVFWNAGNDGSGSGLDADLIDGLDSTQFLRSDESDTMTGDLTINGNLTVNGTTTYVNTETILLSDNILTLNANHTGAPTQDAGWEVNRGSSANSGVLWDETNDWFKLISAGTDLGRIITTADEGSGNGFDADTVDGLEAAQFLRSDADDTATGNIVFQGQITVGNNTAAGATIVMDGQAGNRYIYSNNGEIGFLNSAFAYAAYSDASNNWRVLNDTYAKRFIDSDDNTYLLDPAGTSVLNIIDLEGQIRHNGDTDTYIDFNAANSFQVVTGNSQRLIVNDTAVTAVNQMRSPIYYDSDDITYYGNFAGTSRVNDISLVGEIIHDGDTDTFISFLANDQIGFDTGGATRLAVTNASVLGTVDFIAPRFVDAGNNSYYADPASASVFNTLGIDSDLFHNGDTDNKISFGTDSQTFQTGGVTRLTISNTSVTSSADVYAPRYYDLDNSSYYGDFASTSVMNNISLEGNLQHNGDTDTHITFPAADQIAFVTGGTQRFLITSTYAQSANDLRAPRFVDSNSVSYYADFANTGVSIEAAGTINAGSANLYNGGTTNDFNIGRNVNERFNINVTDGQGYIRYYQDETDATDHSVNFEIISSGFGLNQFNFNKNINAGSNSVSGGFGVFSSGAYAEVFYDYTDETYYADFNNTDVSIRMAGEIIGGNGALATPTYSFVSDPNTGMYRFGADVLGFSAGGNDEFRVYTSYTLAPGSSRAPLFYDSNNTAYYGDFASTSNMNRIDIDDYIRHRGDTDTYFGFSAADTIVAVTANATRLTINTTGVTSTLDVTAPNFYGARFYDSGNVAYYADPASASVFNTLGIDSDLFHNGDTDNKISFGTDTQTFQTGGTTRLTINNTAVTSTLNTYAPRFYTDDYLYHNGDDSYIGFSANDNAVIATGNTVRLTVNTSSVTSTLNVFAPRYYTNDYMVHNGDTDTYIGFDAADNFGVWTGGSERFSVDNDSINALVSVGINKATPSAPLSIQPSGTMGTNPYAAGNKFLDFGDADTVDFTFRGDSFRNIWGVLESAAQFVFADSGATILLSMDASTGDVIVGDQTAQFATPDGAPTFLAALDANKFHVNGGIQLNGIANALSIYAADAANTAINEATFLAVNELGFSAGGGFYMNDTATVRIRGNKALLTTGNITAGNMYASRFYDADNNAYYVDPNGDSQMNTIDIDDYIRHRGDTNTYMGFDSADGMTFVTGGTERFNLDNDSADFSVNVYAPRYYDSNNNTYYVDPASTSIMSRIDIDDYIRHRGDENNYFGFAADDTFRVWTGGVQRLNIDTDSADFAVNVYAPRYYDSDNNAYYLDPASNSVLANLNLAGNNGDVVLRFGPGIPANDDAHIEWKGASNGGYLRFSTADDDGTEYMQFGDYDLVNRGGTFTEWARLNRDYLYHTSDIRAPIFYDQNNTGFYGDFDSTSRMNDISLVGEIIADGDTNTYLDFDAADSFIVVTGGTTRLTVNNTYVQATNQMRAPIYYDSGNTGYYWNPNTSSAHRFQTPSGYVDMGPMNTSYSHFQTDRPKFYFNKTTSFDGSGIEAYDGSATASFPIYYDWNDTFYYGDFAGFSRMNGITFGNPGNGTNTKGRWLSIEGNTDASGEGTARIFFAEHNSTTTSMDAYGMSLVYIGGSTSITSASGQPVTISGIGNGEWGLLGHNNNVNGSWAMKGPRDATYVQASGSFRAPLFYDSNNTAYYGDFAGTSITNIMRANQFQIDGSTYIIDSPSGNYGSIRVDGAAGGWAGYAIRDDWVFMADGATNAGIYNDTDNKWAIQFIRNAGTDLLFNGVKQAETENGYFLATNQMRAPIYYDSADTSRYADLASQSKIRDLQVGDQGGLLASGYPLMVHDSQRYLIGLNNSAADQQYPWLVHDTRNSRANMIVHFNGIGDRFWFEENGDFQAYGTGRFADIALNGGNEDIGLLKTYGSGLGDTMLFDGTEYWEKRVIQTMTGAENSATTTTSEFVKNGNGPFASTYALRSAAYRDFYSDYIPVEPGEEIYGEIAVRYISGSGGLLYYGVERYDKDKRPLDGNNGTVYFVASAVNYTNTGWTTYRGHTTIPTSHTPFNGSDGAGVKYVRIRVLMNYPSGGALREFGPPILKRTNHLSRVLAQGATFEGDVYADRYYDRNDSNFYVDPASISIMNDVRASIFYDRDNTAYFVNPNSNSNIGATNGPVLTMTKTGSAPGNNTALLVQNDYGNHSWGIVGEYRINASGGSDRPSILFSTAYNSDTWSVGFGSTDSNFRIKYDHGWRNSSWGTTALEVDRSRNVWAYGSMRSPIFYDNDNTGYYVDPASTSILAELRVNEYIRHNGDTDTYIRFIGADDMQLVAGGRQMLRMAEGTDPDRLRFVTDTNWTDSNGDWAMSRDISVGRIASAGQDMRAPIYYDSNDTAFYGDFASTSRMNAINANSIKTSSSPSYGELYFADSGINYVASDPSASGSRSQVVGRGLAIYSGYSTGSNRPHTYDITASFNLAGRGFEISADWVSGTGTPLKVRSLRDCCQGWSPWVDIATSTRSFTNTVDLRAPIFYDSNNTAFYIDPNSTSITETMRSNRFEMGGTGYYIDNVTGNYGSILVEGATAGWAGYAIRDDWVFMSNGATNAGIFNDTDNEWAIYFTRNADVQIYYNGQWEERSRSNYMEARGSYRAQIFYDTNDTAFYVDPNSQSRIVNLEATGTITAEGHEVLTRNLQTTSGDQGWDLHGNFAMQAIYGNHNVLNEGNVYNAALFKGDGWTLYGFNGSWVNLGAVPNLTNGKGKGNWGGVNLPRGYSQFIIDCGSSFGYQFMSAFTLSHSTNGNTMDLYFEKSTSSTYNSGTWTTMASATGVGSWPGGTSVKFSDVVGGSYPPYVRLRIIPNFSHPSNAISLGQFFVSAAYGGANSLIGWDNLRNITFNGSIRATQFIDSNDTNYYLDPNSTADAALRIRGGTLHGPNVTWGKYLLVGANGRSGYVNNGDVASVATTDGNLHIDAASGKDLYLNYYDGSNVYFGNGANGTVAQVANDGTFRSPIFYDYNNTTYRGDFASTSIMNVLDIRGEVYNDGWFRNDTSGRGLYNTATGQHFYSDNDDYWNVAGGSAANGIRFRDENGGTIRGYVYADNGNNIGFLNNSAGWALRTNNATTEVYGSLYANIMYDRNSTGYYVDPASTTQLNTLYVDNKIIFNGGASTDDNRGLFFDGNGNGGNQAYAIFREDGAWSFPYPDLRIAFHTGIKFGANASYNGMRFYNDYTMATQVMSINNANDAIGANNVYVNNSLQAGSSLRAPIFYDSNNTSYYMDPAGINSSRFEGVNNRTMAMMGLSGQTRSSKEYYAARPRITGDTNYWTGSMGWGTIDMNTVMDWGSGFIDSWGNPGNQPAGTSHWVGTQAFHYTNGSTRYGWQMVGGPIGNLRFRQQWGSGAPSAWRTVPVFGVNSNNTGGFYADIMYDSNNTAYYVDPASTSDLNSVNINNLRIDGTTNGIYTGNTYLDIRYGSTGAGGIRLYDAGNVIQGYWYANGSGEHGFLDNDGSWAHRIRTGNNSQLFYTNGNLEMQITTTYVQAYGSLRSPIYYDSDNTGYFINAASTSRLETLRTNRLYPCYDNNTGVYFDYPGGDYGSVAVYGDGKNGYEGYSIRGEYVFMSPDLNNVGIYNDTDNEWMIYATRNAGVDLYYNGTAQLATQPGYVLAVNQMHAPIYYDSQDTNYYLDLNGFSIFASGARGDQWYSRNWFRNDTAGTGLINDANGANFYAANGQTWAVGGFEDTSAINLRGVSSLGGTSRFWIHGATDGYQGFLNSGGQWVLRITHTDGNSPGIRFQEEANETWTGDPGADVGKIEYHSNRFYIAAGNNSDRIVQFRRDSTDVSYIANDGVFHGTATSARWADLAERYEADEIYEPGTVLAIGGDKEVTLYQPGMPLAGAISAKPAYRMNDDDYGNDNSIESKMNPFVALKGRIPVKINGSAKKGQWIIADKDGKGRAVDFRTPGINSYDIIGIALEDGENEVEVKI